MAVVDRSLWQKIIQDVVARGGNLIRPWFTDLEPISLDHGLLEIAAPGAEQCDYCRKYASRLFTEAAQSATGRLISVCFLVAAKPEKHDLLDETLAANDDETPFHLNEEYTFQTFVAGPCNRLAHAASNAVSEKPGHAYNPLFLHGSSGLGKTHLLHAVCHSVLEDNPKASLKMLSCEQFVNHFIESVEGGKLHEFRYRYRHVDILAIDDIQFLADHEQSQEEFFHTFNTLYQDRKQIILTSDRGPNETALEERLISRFNWGLVARIDRPCYETRVAIIRKKSRQRGIDLPEDVTCFVAAAIESNTRELEGAIAKLQMLAQVSGRPIDLSLAEDTLGLAEGSGRREVTIDDILHVVTQRYGVRLTDLQSRKRSRSIALPRQICMHLARQMTRHSLEEIGGYFGGRDHTTVLHADKTVKAMRTNDPQFQANLDKLTEDIRVGL